MIPMTKTWKRKEELSSGHQKISTAGSDDEIEDNNDIAVLPTLVKRTLSPFVASHN